MNDCSPANSTSSKSSLSANFAGQGHISMPLAVITDSAIPKYTLETVTDWTVTSISNGSIPASEFEISAGYFKGTNFGPKVYSALCTATVELEWIANYCKPQ